MSGVQVVIPELSRRAITNRTGHFSFDSLPEGSYHLVVRQLGYDVRTFHAQIAADDTVSTTVVLERTPGALLDTVLVKEQAPQIGDLAEFEQRRRAAVGHFITRADIDKMSGMSFTNVLRARVTGVQYVRFPPCAGAGTAVAGLVPGLNRHVPSTPSCLMPPDCYMQVFVDGMRIYKYGDPGLPPNIEQYLTQDIAGIEVYTQSAETPPQFNSTGSACGTLAIWLRR